MKDHAIPPLAIFVTVFALGWGASTCLATGQRGVEERRDYPRHIPAPTSTGVRREAPDAAKVLTPSKLDQGGVSVLAAPLHLPGAEALAAVSDRVKVRSGFVYRDGRQLFALGQARVGGAHVGRDRDQLTQPLDVTR